MVGAVCTYVSRSLKSMVHNPKQLIYVLEYLFEQ